MDDWECEWEVGGACEGVGSGEARARVPGEGSDAREQCEPLITHHHHPFLTMTAMLFGCFRIVSARTMILDSMAPLSCS